MGQKTGILVVLITPAPDWGMPAKKPKNWQNNCVTITEESS